jgi:RNA polymerase primary sigma factor
MYLDELEMLPEYSDGEKRAYTIQAMAGEKDARSKLTEVYLKDVVQIAKIYNGQGVLIEDLIGEGNVALAAAVTMLDSQEKPEDCEGMIVKYVMDAMEELIKENNDSSEVSDKALARVNNIFEKADKLSKEYARKVTVEELCEEEHLSRKAVIDAIRISGFAIDSIETPDELKGIE